MEYFDEQYKRLIEQFGVEGSTGIKPYDYLIEECGELIQAIQHYRRGRCDTYKVANEMADVITLIDCTKHYLMLVDDDIKFYQQRLIDRYLDTPNDGHHTD